ncbi:MAG: DUF1292 domain-containing protein [Bacilli bacterium]|nr:DUF1292 domain-containing protein [Bacilli bacterium]
MENNLKDEKILMEKNGKEVECDVLFTFDSLDTMKSYVAYTDNTIGKNMRKNIFISSYNPFGTKLELEDVTDKKELEMINDVLLKIDQEN